MPLRRTSPLVIGTALLALGATACTGGPSSSSAGSSPGASGSSSGGAAPATYQTQHRGGTLHLVAKSAGGTLDPMVNYTLQYWQLFQATYDGLLAFKKQAGQPSFTVVPDLAQSMPKVTDGGKTYTFTLRKGIKFSNGAPVTTDDVVASFKRIFTVSSPPPGRSTTASSAPARA